MDDHAFGQCDRCSARAQIEISHPEWPTPLSLCGHHVRKSWEFLPDGIEIKIAEGLWLPGLSEDLDPVG